MGEQVGAGSKGDVAQLGEHLPCKQGVESSNLFISISRAVREKLCFRGARAYQLNFPSAHPSRWARNGKFDYMGL